MQELIGARLGHYEIKEQLGKGGMAVVYRALQQPLGREVALKVLAPTLAGQPGFMERFENEARTLARLDHPNILAVIDFDSVDGTVYLAMPYVKGGTLRDVMNRGPLPTTLAWRYLREVGDALAHAHEAGVIHRDLKPSNVLVHADGRALLADFGLARSSRQPLELTSAGFSVGTPGYMAPEQVLGHPIDHRADIYAMGVLTFEMLTGVRPYRTGTAMEIAYASVNDPVPSACALNPVLPDELDRLLSAVLAKEPSQRPHSARELVTALGRLPQRRTTPAPAANPAIALAPPVETPGQAVSTLELLGVKRLRPGPGRLQEAFAADVVAAAEAAAGERWQQVLAAAGVSPATSSAEDLSRIDEGFEVVFGGQAPERLREWGRRALEAWRERRHPASLRLVPGQQRRLAQLLKTFGEGMDEARGFHAHAWRQIDERQFWLVHYSNLLAYGRRRPEKSCHFWTAGVESLLRWAGLANDWFVEEVECGCVTGTYDCVFGIRSARP